MSNAFTSTGSASLGGVVGSAGLVQKAYDRLVEFALRSQPLVRSVADKRPARQAMPGSSVALQIYTDLSVASGTLTETTDPNAVAVGTPTQVVVTLNEYGNAALVTRKLQLFSLADVDPAIADIVAFNMADSIDEVALDTLRQGDNVRFALGTASSRPAATSAVTSSATLTSADIRFTVAKLRAGKAVPRKGSLYWVGIHPEVSHDLRAESGAGGWRLPHEYQANAEIWAGEIGNYEGAYFIESPRMFNTTDGSGSTRVFRTIVAGKQALAEAVSEEPHVVIGPVTDKLMRFRPIGWYGVLGFARYREAALYRIESTSSINLT
jgi:N4-gp56 family major capsid protein